MLKYYSKPVLTSDDNSAYKEGLFDLEIVDNKVEEQFVKLVIQLNLKSTIVRELLDKNIAQLGIKTRTNLLTKYENVINYDDTIEIFVEKNKLERMDVISCVAYIVSNNEYLYKWNEELKDIYEKDYEFEFHQNEILAESTEDKLNYSASGKPFISLCHVPAQSNNGLLFSVDTPNMIQVKIGTELNEAYTKLRNDDKKVSVKGILDSFTAFNSILYALTKTILSDNPEEFKDREWYKALDYCFNDSKYQDFDSFIASMVESKDLDEIYRISQSILNNQVEVKIVDTWRRSR